MAKDFCEVFQDGNIDNLPSEARKYLDGLLLKESVVLLDITHTGWETPDGSFKNDSWTIATYDKVIGVIAHKMFWEDIESNGRVTKSETETSFVGKVTAQGWLEKIEKMEESA